ncbi:MAG: hypothetical protein J0H26_05120 [Alphaproteobacteria bacterium]|nr:hypothetical protein [Alphaproteobacteria bacterium]
MTVSAVFDAGKTRLKFRVIAEDGRCLFADSTPSRTASSLAGVIDTARAEEFLFHALRTAGSRFPLTHFVPVGHGAAAAWLNANGLAVPVMDYEAEIPSAIRVRYEAERPPFAETCSPSLPLGLNLGRQLFCAETLQPRLADESGLVLLPWPQYWAWRLSGIAASEVSSLGCHTDLWSPGLAAWSSLAQARGWHERFAQVTAANAVFGTMQNAAMRAAGLGDCQIVCGAHDSNAALFAIQSAGLLGAGACLISTGTWTVTMAPGAELGHLDPGRDCLANVSVSGAPVPTCRFMGGAEYAAIAGTVDVAPDAAACTECIRSGSMTLPAYANAGGPFPSHRGCLVGAPPRDAKESAALASLYYALMVAYEIALLGPCKTVVLEGAMTKNPLVPGLIAALTGASVYLCAGEAVSIGAARLAVPFDTAAALALTAVAPLAVPGLTEYAARWRSAVAARDAEAADIADRRLMEGGAGYAEK